MAEQSDNMTIGEAELEFMVNGTPRSKRFNDTYFDTEGGLAESRRVFLDGSGLPYAWAGHNTFTIGETGFGTGLNFLATWHAWRTSESKPHHLNYMAVEGFPLSRDELEVCHTHYPELFPYTEELLSTYPTPHPGYHRLHLAGGQITLTLLFGPVLPVLRNLTAKIDAWFLDGFAPDRNPDMWHPSVLAEIGRLSSKGAPIASFIVASKVCRDLESAGFKVEKRKGWGATKENLTGHFISPKTVSKTEPWFMAPKSVVSKNKAVAVIGSGLAGASVAQAFRRRGCSVTVIERHADISSEASATPSAVLMPRLTAGESTDGTFYAHAWHTLLALLGDLSRSGTDIGLRQYGVLHLATTEEETARQNAVIKSGVLPNSLVRQVTPAEATDLAGTDLKVGALHFPGGGTISPRQFCAALLDGSTLRTNQAAAGLERDKDQWRVVDDNGTTILHADCVVLAGGLDSNIYDQSNWLPLTPKRGQLSRIPSNSANDTLTCVLAGEGHITPSLNGQHVIGATFDHVRPEDLNERKPSPEPEADSRNLKLIKTLVPGLIEASVECIGESWAGLRCTTRDHLPLAGPLPNQASYLEDFAAIKHGHRWAQYPRATYHEGLYVLTGLGAHGVVAAPLAADLIVSQAFGDPLPVPRAIAQALHPGRFIVRELKRAKS
jgi:tRNA 5-methylaminomethyl-2-thiouridine biosynthesis bifunctional protein